MEKRSMLVAVGLLFASCSGDPEIPLASCPAGELKTVAIFVRHADRDGELLNEAGRKRARALRDLVFDSFPQVTAVAFTQYKRTHETIQPTLEQASMNGREVREIERDAHDYAGFADAVRKEHAHGGAETVIVGAGHSDTIRPILEQFSREQIEANAAQWFACDGKICPPDYDDLWTVTLCGGAAPEIRKSTYGAPTP